MDKEMFEKGLAIRRQVLGADFVDNAFATADDFNLPLQELVTQYCWGEIWGRPGLDRKTRSMLNLAMLSALNRPHEIKAHVKGALANGLTKDQIKEVFLQVAIYCRRARGGGQLQDRKGSVQGVGRCLSRASDLSASAAWADAWRDGWSMRSFR